MLPVKTKNPVLVLGGHFGGLYVTREFGKRGIEVYVVSKSNDNINFHSRYCKKRIISPGNWKPEDLKKLLKKTAKLTTKRLAVYPISDLDALNLSIVKEELPDDYHLIVGNKKAMEILVNKSKFYRELTKNHIEHPETFFPQDLESVKKIGKDMQFPIFVRPSVTQHFADAFGPTKKGFIAKSYDELLKYYSMADSNKVEVMLQQIILGPAENSLQLEGYFNKEFQSKSLFARKRLRIYPLDFGNTTLCTSVPLSNFTSECGKLSDLIKNLKYNGLASAEYKKDPADGKYKMLEINARVWFHSWLSAKCGINMLVESYLDAFGEKIDFKRPYPTGVKSIHIDYDFLSSMKMFQRGELGITDWVSSMKGVRQAAVLDLNDGYPFFAHHLKNLVFSKKAKDNS